MRLMVRFPQELTDRVAIAVPRSPEDCPDELIAPNALLELKMKLALSQGSCGRQRD